MSKCILCWKNEADSREHIFLKSLYKEILSGEEYGLMIQGSNQKKIRGPKSKWLMPSDYDICKDCNTSVSQPYDRSVYRTTLNLINLSRAATEKLKKDTPIINIQVTETDGDIERYFAKHLACSLNRYGYAVPKVLGDIFHKKQDCNLIKVKIQTVPYYSEKQGMQNKFIEIVQPYFQVDESVLKEYCQIGFVAKIYSYSVFYGTVKYEIKLNVPDQEVVDSFYPANNAYMLLKILPMEGPNWLKFCERAKHTRALVDERPFLFVAIDVRWREHKVH